MAVIIKNTTNQLKNWGGFDCQANSQYEFQEADRHRLMSDSVFLADLFTGCAVISNNGVDITDYDSAVSLIRLRPAISTENGTIIGAASAIKFKGSVSVSSEAGGVAVIDIGNSGLFSGTLYSLSFTGSGGSDNKWLGCFDKDLKGNETLTISPFNMELIGFSFSSSDPNSNTKMEVWKSLGSEGTTKTKVYEITLSNFRTYLKTDLTPVSFAAGDKIALFLRDVSGADPKDPHVQLFFKITSYYSGAKTENFSSDF